MRRSRVVLAMLLLAGCANDIVGPAARLRIVPTTTELGVDGSLRLDVQLGGRPLLPTAVEWLSRDPSTVTVHDGVARGVFPGTAWIVAVRRSAIDSVRLTVRFDDVALGQTGIRAGGTVLRLQGGSWLTLDTTDTQGTFSTAILASSGGVALSSTGLCCRTLGDTTLQINYRGRPLVGTRALLPADVHVDPTLGGLLVHTGNDDLLLMVRDGGFRMRFYFPVRAAPLEVIEVVEPTSVAPGRIRGRLSFEAAGILDEWTIAGVHTFSAIGDRTTTIYIEFDAPLNLQYFARPH